MGNTNIRGEAEQAHRCSQITSSSSNYRESAEIERLKLPRKGSESFHSTLSYPQLKGKKDRLNAAVETNRKKINIQQYKKQPCSIVGYILLESQSGKRKYASGFMISGLLLLTAANVLFSRQKTTGEMVKYRPVYFARGYGGDRTIIGITDYRISEDYLNLAMSVCPQDYKRASLNERSEWLLNLERYDFAMLQLSQNVRIERMPELLANVQPEQNIAAILGYNINENCEIIDDQDREMVYALESTTDIPEIEGDKINMNVNASKLYIGSPIVMEMEETVSIIGINIRELKKPKLNTGLLINESILEKIEEWMAQMSLIPKVRYFKPIAVNRSSRKKSAEYSISDEQQNNNQIMFINPNYSITNQFHELIGAIQERGGISWKIDSPHANKFEIKDKQAKKIVQEGSFHQVVSLNPITMLQNPAFKVKMVKYGSTYPICIGVTTSRRLNRSYSGDYDHKESIGFWSQKYGKGKGRIFIDGKLFKDQRQFLFIKEGDVLCVQMSADRSKLSWKINNCQKAETILPESMRNKELFVFAAMERKNDCVELL